MKISLNWLNDFVDTSDISAEDLGYRLTMSTAEIEGIQYLGSEYEGIVTGKILEVKQHPDADRLLLARVTTTGDDELEIVCGAHNIEEGQIVPVAKIGSAVLSGELKVEKRKIRGIESIGMLCSPKELGLSDDHSGILILDSKLEVGIPFAKAMHLDDVIFDIDNKTLTHRPDLWGHYGMAREVAVLLGKKLKPVPIEYDAVFGDEELKITVKDPGLCPRYCAVGLRNIKIEDSPQWLKCRLNAVGVRAINNIVDITNYVMLELGQPQHAFDKRQIEGMEIIVRRALDGEKMITLDGTERELTSDMLMIADRKRSVGLAGVMGGENSEIMPDTTEMILESANFDPVSIRKTSSKLGLRTESATRFEKSLDPKNALIGIHRFLKLVTEICPEAEFSTQIVDVNNVKSKDIRITLNPERASLKIGTEIKPAQMVEILQALEFDVEKKNGKLTVIVPSFRATKDVSIEDDLIEEIARIHGYDNLDPALPEITIAPDITSPAKSIEQNVTNILAYELGYSEVQNYAFDDDSILSKLAVDSSRHVKLANPLTHEQTKLRTSLIPNMLQLIEKNLKYSEQFRIFELGKIYLNIEYDGDGLPVERKMLCGLICERKGKNSEEELFYQIKGDVEALLDRLHITSTAFEEMEGEEKIWYHPAKSAIIKYNDVVLGSLGEVHPRALKSLELDVNAGLFYFDFEAIVSIEKREKLYVKSSKFPGTTLDLNIVVDVTVKVKQVIDVIQATNPQLINSESGIKLIDIYRGEQIPAGKKSMTFEILYQSMERTLTDDEVKKIHAKVIKSLEKQVGGRLRE